METQHPLPQKGGTAQSQFSAHVCFGQTAGWIKMPLGTKVGSTRGRIVLHGDPAPPPKRGTAPIFGPCLMWPTVAHLSYCWALVQQGSGPVRLTFKTV